MTVTRGDLTDGYKAVQSTHAAINFTFEHPARADPWFKDSNYLIQLVAKDEKHLKQLVQKCEKHNLKHTVFREPDIGNQITAICIEPSEQTQRMVSSLPLLFKSKINNNDTEQNNGYESQNGKRHKESLIQKAYRYFKFRKT